MAFRSVMHSHPCRNFHPVMVMDSLPILPGLAKALNFPRDSAAAIPRRPVDLSCFDKAVFVHRDSVMGRAVPAVYRASPSSADPFDSRDSAPGFADSVVADYSSPAVDLAFLGPAFFDPGFVAVRLLTVAVAVAAAAVAVVALLSFDPSCSADFSATGAVVPSDAASVSQSSS